MDRQELIDQYTAKAKKDRLDIVFENTKFSGNLSGLDLDGSHFINCDFTDCDLSHSYFEFGKFENCIFQNANLTRTWFASIKKCDFTGANFAGAIFDTYLNDSILPNGLTPIEYVQGPMQEFLQSAGAELDHVMSPDVWLDSYGGEGDNPITGPIKAAFDAITFEDIPLVHQADAKIFIALHSAGLLEKEFLDNPTQKSAHEVLGDDDYDEYVMIATDPLRDDSEQSKLDHLLEKLKVENGATPFIPVPRI